MTARKVTTARGTSKSDDEAKAKRIAAYKRVFEGNSNRDDGDMVLADLLHVSGFFRPPNYADWMARTKTTEGFPLHCALQAARAEPIRHILNFLGVTDDQMIALERAAREEAKR